MIFIHGYVHHQPFCEKSLVLSLFLSYTLKIPFKVYCSHLIVFISLRPSENTIIILCNLPIINAVCFNIIFKLVFSSFKIIKLWYFLSLIMLVFLTLDIIHLIFILEKYMFCWFVEFHIMIFLSLSYWSFNFSPEV